MTRRPTLPWGVRAELIHGCVSVIWLASLVNSIDINGTTTSPNSTVFHGRGRGAIRPPPSVHASPEVLAHCGKPVTLTCDTSSVSASDIRGMHWVVGDVTLCKLENRIPTFDPKKVTCESTEFESGDGLQLTMTLLNMTPHHQGEYLCKLRSRTGATSTKTNVTLQECISSSNHSPGKSQLECGFYGIYPSGTVHWFHGTANLTQDASTAVPEKDPDGLFTVKSTLQIEQTQPVNCSLWIPSTRTYLASEIIQMSMAIGHYDPKSSSPATLAVKWLWIPIMVGLVVKSIT